MIEKNGVFIGLICVPIGNEKEIKNEIESIFETYKKRLQDFNNSKTISANNLFNPQFYSLFGSYDLAVISKVDDFIFSHQKFNPNTNSHELFIKIGLDENAKRPFNFYVYNCTMSSDCNGKASVDENIKNDKYDCVFPSELGGTTRHAYCSISSFKIKSSLLIGTGVLVIDAVKKAIKHHIDDHNQLKEANNGSLPQLVSYLILDTTSWHEITLVLTSDCLVTLGNLVYRIRELISFEDDIKGFLKIDEQILRNSLLAKWSGVPIENIKNTNIFSTSNTYFGVQYALLAEPKKDIFEKWIKNNFTGNKTINANVRVATIPTQHLTDKNRVIGKFEADNILYNDSDIEPGKYLGNTSINGQYDSDLVKMLRYYRDLIRSNKKAKTAFKSSIRRTHTTPKIKYAPKSFSEDITERIQKHGHDRTNIAEKLDKYLLITSREIADMQQYLTELYVSKAVRLRFIKALNNYNDIISDRLLYMYMIEMHPFIMGMKGYLKNKVEETAKKINGKEDEAHKLMIKINGFARVLEHVQYNIIQHSLLSMDLSKFNLNFHCGIQQNLSVCNFLFGLCRKVIKFYENDEINFLRNKSDGKPILSKNLIFHSPCAAYLSNTSGIISYEYICHLNYFHMTEPATFIVTIFKEALNGLFARAKHDKIFYKKDKNENSGIIEENMHYSKMICKRILDWEDKTIREDSAKFYIKDGNYIKDKEADKLKMRFDILYYMFNAYPIKASIHLQQEVVSLIQKSDLVQNKVDSLLRVSQYVELIDDNLIEYVIVDYNNYKYYYGCDDPAQGGCTDLYKTWFWIHFFQEPDVYTTSGKISTLMFLKAMFRMTMLYILAEFKEYTQLNGAIKNNYSDLFNNGKNSKWFSQLKKYRNQLLEKHYDSAFAICKIMHENSFLSGFLNMKNIKEYKMNLESLDLDEDEMVTYNSYKSLCRTLFQNILESGEVSETNINSLLRFRDFQGKEDGSQMLIVWGCIRATFLSYLQALTMYIEVPVIRLPQDDKVHKYKKGWIDINSVKPNTIQPDPNGGFFVTQELKQKYFLANNYLFKILYNFTLVCKIEYFDEIILQKEKRK